VSFLILNDSLDMGKTSVVHQYFKSIDGGYKCTITGCSNPDVRCAGNTTSNQWSHLEHNHLEIFNELKSQKQPAKRKSIIDESQSATAPIKKSKTEYAEQNTMKMIARRNLPFTVVDDPFFQELLSAKYKGINLRKSSYYARTVLPKVANESMTKLRNEIGDRFYSITTDGWTALNKPNVSYYR